MSPTLSLVALLLAAAGLAILSWSALSSLAWAYGAEAQLPLDRGRADAERLACAGVDAQHGAGMVFAAILIEIYARTHAVTIAIATQNIILFLAIPGYVVFYFWALRPRVAGYRLRLRSQQIAKR